MASPNESRLPLYIGEIKDIIRTDSEKIKYQNAQWIKPWKRCHECEGPARFCCTKCATNRIIDKTRYCSRECQKKNWPIHQHECSQVARSEQFLSSSEPHRFLFRSLQIKQTGRWMHPINQSGLLDWASRQAFLYCGIEDLKNTALHIEFAPIIPSQPQSPIWPQEFSFGPVESLEDIQNLPTAQRIPGERVGMVYWRIDECRNGKYAVVLDGDLEENDIQELTPHWPWIFAHCCAMGDISTYLSLVRYTYLITIINTLNCRGYGGAFQPFISPRFNERSHGFRLSLDSLNDWLKLAYPFVSCVKSAYKLPCEDVIKQYEHLTTGPSPVIRPNLIPSRKVSYKRRVEW